MDDTTHTSISAGLAVYGLLTGDRAVAALAGTVFPIVADRATLPYVVYRRAKTAAQPSKAPGSADTVLVEVRCYTADYESGVRLAEAVRSALDFARWRGAGVAVRSCVMTDADEGWEADAYVQQMIFTIKI